MTPINSCRMEPYRTLYSQASQMLQETERVAARVIVLPTGTVEPGMIRVIGKLLGTWAGD